ncbi:SNARE domain protein [Theileria parva strain Muguga]|uniref:SNARE domain protein n=1 Tax=Theileria parva strain Muguga TaxID=333668 RepID=UPI001C6173A6|nr:SNARE domain protein [Theileria parva strain Muguga]EAN32915.2 SNARE domain protein [Theileria parva strain Muguga]
MSKKYAKSTLGAVAARNTKAANVAKREVADFKNNVKNVLTQGYNNDELSNIQRKKILNDIEKLQNDSSNVLSSLYEYSEELRLKNESYVLYDSLLDDFKQNMGKIEDLRAKLVNYQTSIPNSIRDVKHDIHVDEDENMELVQDQLYNLSEYPLENTILDERSEQIKQLRSSVYGIQDMYIEIGDMVDYQGDQLDNIESNLLNVVSDSRTATNDLRSIDRRAIPKMTYFVVFVLLVCVLIVIVIYSKI